MVNPNSIFLSPLIPASLVQNHIADSFINQFLKILHCILRTIVHAKDLDNEHMITLALMSGELDKGAENFSRF